MKERKKYDFFISHASEDKDLFVRPLVNKLTEIGFNIWYDEFTLKIGDSLFVEISEGIKNSSFGIIILSENFLKKEWTKKELNGLISKEIFTNEDVILPIWLDITAQKIYDYSPILADKVAISVKNNEIDKVIEHIFNKTKLFVTTKEMIIDKIDFLKKCDLQQQQKYILDVETRIKNLFLYQEAYYIWYNSENIYDENEWDNILSEQKKNQLLKEYGIPYGVWENFELVFDSTVSNLIRLLKKWVKRKLTIDEAEELFFLMDDYLDVDPHYILYGFPHNTIKNHEVYLLSISGIYKVGLKKEHTIEEHSFAVNKVFEKYFSK